MTAGRFVWRELASTDVPAVRSFYSQLFSWGQTEQDMGMPEPYVMFTHDSLDESTAGVLSTPAPGVPSHWVDYITVHNAEEALAKATSLGAKALTDVIAAPGVGRFAMIEDPVGAVFGILQSDTPGASDTERTPPMGTFCWSQLMTTDPEKASPFYEALFGWTSSPMGNGAVVFTNNGTSVASMMKGDQPYSHWLKYVAVEDADAAFEAAKSLGATPFMAPSTIPDMGRFAVLADPSGAVFALWKDLAPTS
ncbi:MAG: VOC family protein [Myxococcota bacterium]